MIKKINLKNFKCFADETFFLTDLNILCGLNSSGKSTLIQSLLLLSQSREVLPEIMRLKLSGQYYDFGEARDLLNNFAEQDLIEINTSDESQEYFIRANYISSSNSLKIDRLINKSSGIRFERNFPRFHLKYISANRTGPVTIQNNVEVASINPYGDNVIGFIADNLERPVPKRLCHPQGASNKLHDQLDAWLGEISPGIEISVQTFRDLSLAAARFTTKLDNLSTESHRPNNVGFGLFYILPILTTILCSKSGDLIIIENPEAHLHPRGQASIGRLICLSAFGGRQVIMETHSDHVVNASRLLVKEKTIDVNSINLLYFESTANSTSIQRQVVKIDMDESGRILNWPNSFMDQWDNDLLRLI